MTSPVVRRLRTVLTSPPHVTAAKVVAKADSRLRTAARRRRDRVCTTYTRPVDGDLARLLPPVSDATLRPGGRAGLLETADLHQQHVFDILGSGWVHVHHGMTARGLERHRFPAGPTVRPDPAGAWLDARVSPANRDAARRVWSLVDDGYQPIDWHLDIKSGYRWPETTWYRDLTYGGVAGVDVKVPWELARAHHVTQLAFAHAAAGPGAAADGYWREFRNQVLDFIATNPPRYGVNWSCTMDVAIRVTNWLVAYDIFRAYGVEPDDGFRRELLGSVVAHGRHIVANLEWSPSLRSNHYLADIAGLVVVAAYAPASTETDAWLSFGLGELLAETTTEFTPDGANFEASTAYHRLSSEMVTYATAFALAAGSERYPPLGDGAARVIPLPHRLRLNRRGEVDADLIAAHLERVARMAQFSSALRRPDGSVPQIGDNDSGRFLKLSPSYLPVPVAQARQDYASLDGYESLDDDATYWSEDVLDQDHLLAAIDGLTGANSPKPMRSDHDVETELVRGLVAGSPHVTSGNTVESTPRDGSRGPAHDEAMARARTAGHRAHTTVVRPLGAGQSLTDGLTAVAFEDVGLYVFRSERVYLLFRCGPIGQNGNGGHAHNDQLGIELTIDGVDWFRDPGTYLYTPLPLARDTYRSVAAHWAPRVGAAEPSDLSDGLFRLGSDPGAEVIARGDSYVVARHSGYGADVVRSVVIGESTIEVVDLLPGGGPDRTAEVTSPQELATLLGGTVPFSPGYGVLERQEST